MIIEIDHTTTIRQIQEVFSGSYPYLAINFFVHCPDNNQLYHKKDMIPVDKTMGDIKRTHISAMVEINPWDTIVDVENEFFQGLGLRVQVLRNCYGHWILPEGAESLSLKKQNEIGGKVTDPVIHPDIDMRVDDNRYD